MTLEEALLKIAELEGRETALQAEKTGLQDEKTALLRKRDELLGKLTKFKKFEPYADQDIEDLIRIKTAYESSDTDAKSTYEAAFLADKKRFEDRLSIVEQERQTEKSERDREIIQVKAERAKSAAIAEFSKQDHGVYNPEQLFRLVGDRVRLNESGKAVVGDEYKEMPLGDFIKELRADPDYQNQFKASGVTGSGSSPSTGGGGTGTINPWKKETFNLTQQGKIYRESPALATSLKAAAGVK